MKLETFCHSYMIKYFKIFFYPPVVTYSYNQPKEIIVNKITEVFKRKVRSASNSNISAMFLTDNMFAISLKLPIRIVKLMFCSTLVGTIIKSRSGITEIETKARPGFGLYGLFFLAVIFGLNYMYEFIRTGSTAFRLLSLAMMIVVPALSIGFSNIAVASIRKRYKIYIDRN